MRTPLAIVAAHLEPVRATIAFRAVDRDPTLVPLFLTVPVQRSSRRPCFFMTGRPVDVDCRRPVRNAEAAHGYRR